MKTLAALKLASAFCGKKDCRPMMQNVLVQPIYHKNIINLYATDGYKAIRITMPLGDYQVQIPINEQLTCESIKKAIKVSELALLKQPDFEINFPSFSKVFDRDIEPGNPQKAGFNVKFMLDTLKALESFRKDIKQKVARVEFQELSHEHSNYLTMSADDVQIAIAIMPLRGAA